MKEGSVDKRKQYERLDSIRPWTQAPNSRLTLDTCITEIAKTPIHPVGYEAKNVSCSKGKVSVNVLRSTGYSSWLKAWALAYPEIKVRTVSNGSKGSYYKSIPMLPIRPNTDLLRGHSFKAIQNSIFDTGQIDGSGINVTEPVETKYPEFPEYKPLYATGTFSIKTKRPRLWLEFFGQWTSTVITGVEYRLQKHIYVIEGKFYVPNF